MISNEQQLRETIKNGNYTIISPKTDDISWSEARKLRKKMVKWLRKKNFSNLTLVEGDYNGPEPSIIIEDIDLSASMKLGRKYKQESFVHCGPECCGLIYTGLYDNSKYDYNPPITDSDGLIKIKIEYAPFSDITAFYTEINLGGQTARFQTEFDWDTVNNCFKDKFEKSNPDYDEEPLTVEEYMHELKMTVKEMREKGYTEDDIYEILEGEANFPHEDVHNVVLATR